MKALHYRLRPVLHIVSVVGWLSVFGLATFSIVPSSDRGLKPEDVRPNGGTAVAAFIPRLGNAGAPRLKMLGP